MNVFTARRGPTAGRRVWALAWIGLGCSSTIAEPGPNERIVVDHPGPSVAFVAIGDYGKAGAEARAVADRVHQLRPEFIVTLGDNNYEFGTASTIDENIGQYYHDFIHPYHGRYGAGADRNRFFPSLGNHDWWTPDLAPYLEYFTLPGNERYYTFRFGPVDLFAIDSDDREPDGNTVDSAQARWLQDALAASRAPWQVVYFHHAPYSSGSHGSTEALRWPFHAWGADAVLTGHDHHYERIVRPEGVYVVNGLGGHPRRGAIREALPESAVRFVEEHGAMLVEATETRLELRFVTASGRVVDESVLER